MSTGNNKALKLQRWVVVVAIALFLCKCLAWYLTGSVAILTDALESIVNVLAGLFGLYSLQLSLKPSDKEHPYGHGKVEFISSAIEGILVIIAGFIIIYESIHKLWIPVPLQKLDYGLALIGLTAIINYITGHLCVEHGVRNHSPLLVASGQHLKTDTYSTLGLLAGILLLILTGYTWIDSIVALVFALFIVYTGYKIIRRSVSGIMDESDQQIIHEVVEVINQHRHTKWIDVHNLRVINYAGFYHIDCHLTLPFYLSIQQGHQEQEKLFELVRIQFHERIEFFIHMDACLPEQCGLCQVDDCPERVTKFIALIPWTAENVQTNERHLALPQEHKTVLLSK